MRREATQEELAEDKVLDPVRELAQKKMDQVDLFAGQGRKEPGQ